MTLMDAPSLQQKQAAVAALRYIYPNLVFTMDRITLDAAKFAFEVLRRVDLGARAAYGFFKLYSGTIAITKWGDIPKAVYDGAKAAAEHPNKSMKSAVSLAFVALPLQRLLQQHLNDPDTFPCPDFRDLRSLDDK